MEVERGENNENSRGKVNTVVTGGKKSYIKSGLMKEDSPGLKLTTGDKKRSNRNSL